MPRNEEPEVIDLDAVAEAELLKLTRQYRILEGDRATYAGEASGKLKRTRKLIRFLRNEQKDVLADLNIATSLTKKRQDIKVNTEVDEQLKQFICLDKCAKTEKASLTELDYQIKKMDKAVADLRAKTITDFQHSKRVLAGQKSVAMLENRLDSYTKRFNITVTENFKLRIEIDHLLKERAHFNQLWDKLVHSLSQGKKFMLDLIEQASIAYDQRDEWGNKLQALRQIGNQNLVLHTKEIRSLQRKLDHDAKLQEFLGLKGQRRINLDLDGRQERKKQALKESMERQLESYKEILTQIQEFCGESDIERLAMKFIKQEEENFALFNYVNELNHESENLSYAIADLKTSIDEQRELNNKRAKQQKDNIATLKEKLQEETEKTAKEDQMIDMFDEELEEIYASVDKIFQLIHCDNDPLFDLLGDNEIINQYNILLYLGIIEQMVVNLLQQLHYREKMSGDKKPPKILKKQKDKKAPAAKLVKPDAETRYKINPINILVPNQPCPLCVEQENVSDVIDSLQFAQALNEVEEKLSARMKLPHALDRLHNVSACHLPQSRKIIQQRYQ